MEHPFIKSSLLAPVANNIAVPGHVSMSHDVSFFFAVPVKQCIVTTWWALAQAYTENP